MELNKAEYSKKDMYWMVTKTAVIVFVITMIYARFLNMEIEMDAMESKIEFNDKEQTRRLDTKTGRNKTEIDKLKQPNYGKEVD